MNVWTAININMGGVLRLVDCVNVHFNTLDPRTTMAVSFTFLEVGL